MKLGNILNRIKTCIYNKYVSCTGLFYVESPFFSSNITFLLLLCTVVKEMTLVWPIRYIVASDEIDVGVDFTSGFFTHCNGGCYGDKVQFSCWFRRRKRGMNCHSVTVWMWLPMVVCLFVLSGNNHFSVPLVFHCKYWWLADLCPGKPMHFTVSLGGNQFLYDSASRPGYTVLVLTLTQSTTSLHWEVYIFSCSITIILIKLPYHRYYSWDNREHIHKNKSLFCPHWFERNILLVGQLFKMWCVKEIMLVMLLG